MQLEQVQVKILNNEAEGKFVLQILYPLQMLGVWVVIFMLKSWIQTKNTAQIYN